MQAENMQQQTMNTQQPEIPSAAAPEQQHHDPIMQQLAAQQATISQMVADQQAMWQHIQVALQQQGSQGNSGGNPSAEPHSSADHGEESCEHHKDPAEQAEHFVRMAEKFSRGEVDMDTVAGGLSFLNSQSGAFWKGLLVGGGLTLLVGNETIRNSVTSVFTRSDEDKAE
ncbi:hypothetical protein [uncultured Desulfuromusa sp.]|uniref:hypothetical protein n=1 Tax=uncultured Desulfuromusa sp. TaxID=219183 RepID=UPI002AA8F0AB|nr:hypothetical protein [uncultured Desulfuromusa sp.]